MKVAASIVSVAMFLCFSIGQAELARADEEVRVRPIDAYIAGFGGYSFPFSTDVSFGGFTAPNVELQKSPSFGGKVGIWITAPRKTLGIDIGVELDVTHFNPDFKMPGTFELGATYFGVNLLARVPMGVTSESPNGRWFPYVGIGGGGQHLTMQAPGTTQGRNTAPAFQGLGGVKMFVARHIAIFAEGKFIHASHNQGVQGTSIPLELTLDSAHGVGGLAVHF